MSIPLYCQTKGCKNIAVVKAEGHWLCIDCARKQAMNRLSEDIKQKL